MPKIMPDEMNYVSKPWGYEIWICNNDRYCGKKLFIRQGKHLSFHHHKIKDEVLYVESGKVLLIHNEPHWNNKDVLKLGQAYHVLPGTSHQLYALEDTMIIEFSTHHEDSDSYRENRELQISEQELQDVVNSHMASLG